MDRCKECGTSVDEVPLGRPTSREGRVEYLKKLINELPDLEERDLNLRIILREIARLL